VGHVVVGGEGAEELTSPAAVEGAVPIGESVERRGGWGGGGGSGMEPVENGSRGRGGGVGVTGRRRRGHLRRRRGGDGVRMHAGAEEDGERLRGVVPGHVMRSE
jgi:hypothetical protein